MRCADRGDGTYENPVLLCDYSDPDVIRVGDTYYMTASSLNYVPGLPVLVSGDLVNWQLVNYALPNIPEPAYAVPQHARGVWAPAIRYHDGVFHIYYGMPDEGIFVVRAKDPLGAWEPPVCVLAGKGLIDPCPFWDEDGSTWLVHGYARSRIGFKSVLGIFPMNAEGTKAIGEDHILYDGRKTQPTIEGPKVCRRGEWVCIFAPAGGVETGWQTVLRSRSIAGPWEERIVLRQGDTSVNGPHQGAWVTTPAGQDWFVHFQSRGVYGRVTHLQPMVWREDGWPVIGEASEGETCGVPVMVHQKPEGRVCPATVQQMQDDFEGRLGLQWQFMGTWRDDFFRVGPEGLRLYARPLPPGGKTLWNCPQVLSQKIAASAFTATVRVDASQLSDGEQAGLVMLGGEYAYAALRRMEGRYSVACVQSRDGGNGKDESLLSSTETPVTVLLRLVLRAITDSAAVAELLVSTDDGSTWKTLYAGFEAGRHTWVGGRVGLFAMPVDGRDHGGHALFGPFTVEV